jgi:hypothetical protein
MAFEGRSGSGRGLLPSAEWQQLQRDRTCDDEPPPAATRQQRKRHRRDGGGRELPAEVREQFEGPAESRERGGEGPDQQE